MASRVCSRFERLASFIGHRDRTVDSMSRIINKKNKFSAAGTVFRSRGRMTSPLLRTIPGWNKEIFLASIILVVKGVNLAVSCTETHYGSWCCFSAVNYNYW